MVCMKWCTSCQAVCTQRSHAPVFLHFKAASTNCRLYISWQSKMQAHHSVLSLHACISHRQVAPWALPPVPQHLPSRSPPNTSPDPQIAPCLLSSHPETCMLLWQQAQSHANHHDESDTANEGAQGPEGAPAVRKRGLFKRGWGSGRKGNTEKQVKPSKSKLGEGSAALAQKSAGVGFSGKYMICILQDDMFVTHIM